MSGGGAGKPGNRGFFDPYPVSKGELRTFWNKPDINKVIKQAAKEVESWPEWVKRNCEAVFGRNK